MSAEAVTGRCAWKHCRQRTGRPWVGLKGTVVSIPHAEHLVRVSVREMPAAAGPLPMRAATPDRLDLHGLQRFGSFLNSLSKKNNCSPAVKMNSPPQSLQVKRRSMNSMPLLPFAEKYGARSYFFGEEFGFAGQRSCSNRRHACGEVMRWRLGCRLLDKPRRRPAGGRRGSSPAPYGPSCDYACERALL